MQTDKDLFNLIKEAYPLNPREEFVSSTSNKLRQSARKLNRKSRIKQFSFASTNIAICAIVISWFFFYGGIDILTNNLNSFGERNSSTSVNEQEPLVYIYQSHNTESFLTEAKVKEPNKALHETKNITLVGERLKQSLQEKGINSIHDKTNIMEILNEQGLSFGEAYKISREPLEDAIDENKNIKMVFDIHRDSRKRSDTTIKMNGKDFPRIAFTVSSSSVNYEGNLKFAQLLHSKIEEKYPSLSRGVIVKDNPQKQNTYNQDVLDNSVLLEIGGVENTLQEEYRTVDVLAEVIKDILVTSKQTDITTVISVEEQNMIENMSVKEGFVPQENGTGFFFTKEK
ncbi:stage II sporulation protein P [Metabacillus rhizolycopersici]|uniref:Stage II sporulation protein P n=1 Tax=Metabacillus rhizolycopersici TaxID=2875709 RepID=A0ABS7UY30_9BACI|nr:stage II sporulation protein P [Metabacillus rhizolycopersici]MBZ5753041.1 stage II sporulation protein P [Metabacillus rhizolycopersici]